jgi:ABC-2 type transport system ATP-binding protein
MLAIEAQRLRRTFVASTGVFSRSRKEIHAVRGIDFAVERGELFGLLGPNGAGKSTTIKMLITLLLPTSGTARVFGHDVVTESRAVRRRIGYVFGGDRGLYERLSALDNLRYFAELFGVDPRVQKRRIPELLELVGLAGRESERVEGFSRGMRQRLHIARGLIHDPDALFLDEPTIGLDPVGARELRATLSALKAAGKTILLTTHYMFEADALCDRIVVISNGGIIAEGSPAAIKDLASAGQVLEVEAFGVDNGVVSLVERIQGVRAVTVEERGQAQAVVVQAEPGVELTADVLACLDGVKVGRVTARDPTLEDAYIELVSTGGSER